MNLATQWRLDLAQKVGAVYAANPKVRVVILAGSTARNMADRHSDIEIDIFWNEPPTDEDRKSTIAQAGGEIEGYWPFEDDEWGEVANFGGLKADMSSFLVETMDRYLTEVIDQADTDTDKQLLIAAVQHGVLLADTDANQLTAWQTKANTYSDALVEAMIKTHLGENPRWYARHALAERNDTIYLYQLFTATVERLLSALCGLNRIYIAHPSFKWLDALTDEMKIAPPQLADRLTRAFRADTLTGVCEMDQLVEEVFDLAEAQLPHLDLAQARVRFSKRGPTWDELPPEIPFKIHD